MLKLLAYLGLNISAFEQSLLRAQGKASAFGTRVSSDLSSKFKRLFMIGSLIQFGETVIDNASHFDDLSKHLGISTDALQKLEFAARQSGASIDSFVRPFQTLAKNQIEAIKGSGEARDAFAAMGVTISDLKSKSVEQLFFQVAEALAKGETNTVQMATALQLFGRSAGEILPAIKEGLGQSAEEAKKWGAVMDAWTIGKVDKLGDAFSKLWISVKALGAGVIAHLTQAAQNIGNISSGMYKLMSGDSEGASDDWAKAMVGMEENANGDGGLADKEARLKSKQRSKLNQTLLESLEEDDKAGSGKHSSSAGRFDSLARIGGFGTASSYDGGIPEKQLTALQQIERNTKVQMLRDDL